MLEGMWLCMGLPVAMRWHVLEGIGLVHIQRSHDLHDERGKQHGESDSIVAREHQVEHRVEVLANCLRPQNVDRSRASAASVLDVRLAVLVCDLVLVNVRST